MRLSKSEAGLVLAEVRAEAVEVASEHCAYLMRQGITSADALALIGMAGRPSWGGAINAYAANWIAMQRRNVLTHGFSAETAQ